MSKFDDIKIPDNIDEVTKMAINRGKTYNKNRKYKKVMIASAVTIAIGTSVISIGIMNPSLADSIPILRNVVEYFNTNNESLYKSDKNDLEKTVSNLNLTTKDNGIELIINSISIDDNYITILHTVKSNKKIEEMSEFYKDAYFANPIVDAYIDGNSIIPPGIIEHEATYTSDYELKGMRKIDVSNIDIRDNAEIEFCIDEIFGVKGNWNIKAKIDKSKSSEKTHKYNIDKDYTINNTYYYNGEKIDINHNINIEKIIISPLASKMVIKEKQTKSFDDWEPMLGNGFALFDEKGNSLDVIDKGFNGYDPITKIATNSIEFIKASEGIKSLTLVPLASKEIENKILEPKNINKLPITFKVSEYGKLVVVDVKITDKDIEYTYYKDGVVPNYPGFWFYDENGKEVSVSASIKESLDRSTGMYTTILNLEGNNNDISQIRKIKQISTFSQADMKLVYDQQIKIDLEKD